MADAGAVPALADIGTGRRPRARRLQAEQATSRSGNADRAATVGRMRHRQHADSDRRRGAAARAAGAERLVPRVARRPEETRLDRGREAEFRGVGLAEDDEAGTLQPPDDLAVVVGNRVAEEGRSVGGRRTGIESTEIFEQI